MASSKRRSRVMPQTRIHDPERSGPSGPATGWRSTDEFPEGPSDCGDHEWYNADGLVEHCYHCKVDVRPYNAGPLRRGATCRYSRVASRNLGLRVTTCSQT